MFTDTVVRNQKLLLSDVNGLFRRHAVVVSQARGCHGDSERCYEAMTVPDPFMEINLA